MVNDVDMTFVINRVDATNYTESYFCPAMLRTIDAWTLDEKLTG